MGDFEYERAFMFNAITPSVASGDTSPVYDGGGKRRILILPPPAREGAQTEMTTGEVSAKLTMGVL